METTNASTFLCASLGRNFSIWYERKRALEGTTDLGFALREK